MDFEKEITELVSGSIPGVVIVEEETNRIAYAGDFFTQKYDEDPVGKDAMSVMPWLLDCPVLGIGEAAVEWESIDMESRIYYRIYSSLFVKEDKKYKVHLVTDVTEYMNLNRDTTKYMSFFKKLSAFQTAVLKKLSDTFYELLPMLTDYFKTGRAYFLVQREANLDIITYSKKEKLYSNDRIVINDAVEKVFDMSSDEDIMHQSLAPELREALKLNGGNDDSAYRMLCGGSISGQKYVIYLSVWPGMDKESLKENTILSVIRLYVENGIMKEKLLYDSEHDKLTGLYNKGKYLDMLEREYKTMDSIGIFNFDVNNLKKINDTVGHEAGDQLIIKAANSIRKVISNKAHGYRMGGDEFLMVVCDVTRDEVMSIKERWEKELARLNTLNDGIDCVIAVGVVYGEKGYDLAELMKQADERMYEDKKAKKKPGEEIR